MKHVLLCLSFILISGTGLIQAQTLQADAGFDSTVCLDVFVDTFFVGGMPTAMGGTPPYSYLWATNIDFIPTNPQELTSTTDPNPSLTLSSLSPLHQQFFLRVTDSTGAQAIDSITVTTCTYAPMPLGQAAYYHTVGDTIELNIWSGFTCIGDSMEWFPKDHIVSSPFSPTIQVLIGDINFDYNSYYVEFYNEHGCVGTGGHDPLVAGVYPLGLSDISKMDLNFYPNPSSGEVNINSSVPMDRIEVLDLNGRVMVQFNRLNQTSFMFNEDLPAGIYIVQVTSAEGIETRQMIRQ